MRVTLAYPLDGHQPDETVVLPEDEARQLVHDGLARLVDDASPEQVQAAAQANQVTTVAPPPAEQQVDVTGPSPPVAQEQPEASPEPVAGQPNEEAI